MKTIKTILIVLITCYITIGNAQIINIPDANFKAKLLEADITNTIAKDASNNSIKIDVNNDGEIQESEALLVFTLFVNYSSITDLTGIEYFTNLESLDCYHNQLTVLNVSNNINLTRLGCGYNQLALLDVTNNINLTYMNCYSNQLAILDVSNNTNLTGLSCGGNQLTSLDVSNNINIETLFCDNNQLTELDVSNNTNLQVLRCYNNSLTELDVSNNTNLLNLQCSNNSLTELDVSNTGLSVLEYNDNPNLIYVNQKNGRIISTSYIATNCPNLEFVCADTEEINGLNTYFTNVGMIVSINSYCTFTLGGNYNTITGTSIFDLDNNGCDVNDFAFPYLKLNIDDGTETGSTFTTETGNYNFYTQDGNFTITPDVENPSFFNVTPVVASINFADVNNNITTQNFCVTPNGTHNDLEIVIAPTIPARPGFDAEYVITYKNKGNQTLSGDINLTYDDTVLDYLLATEAPTTQTTGSLTWAYTNLLPFESRSIYLTLNVNSPMETPAVNIDDVLPFTTTINPITGDELPDDNVFTFNQVVVGSYDPNDITCIEGNMVNPSEIGEYLHYIINFENTGNYEAENVVVKTTIDPSMFDVSTLQVLNTTHNAEIKVTGNIAEIIFEGIFLVPEGQGSILLKLKTLNTLNENDTVTKNAEIFFDYNFPIETNNANTTFALLLNNKEFETDTSITIYPNPVKDNVIIKANNAIKTVSIYDVQGRVIMTKIADQNEVTIDLNNKAQGIYFAKVTSTKGTNVEKIIKE